MRNSTSFKFSRQTGHVALIGIIALVVLIIAVIGTSVYFAGHKEKPALVYQPPAVSVDDKLSDGKSNKELIQDARIINEGVKRDATEQTATSTVLADQSQPIGDGSDTSTTVEASRLSSLQTAFISESDRRLKALNDSLQLLPKLTTDQQPTAKKLINDEITSLTGLKAKAASETTSDAFSADKTALGKEYGNYLLALVQTNLLAWANDQTLAETKVNTLGGKYQERLNDAADQGKDTAKAQILVNSLQASKTTSQGLTTSALKDILAVKPGDYNANRSVLKTYYTKLSTAHDGLSSVLQSASSLTVEMTKL